MGRRRIGLLTGGGDCAGLNAVIRAVVKSANLECGAEVIGFRDGFRGLVFDDSIPLDYNSVANIMTLGGTILGTSRNKFFRIDSETSDKEEDQTARALEVFHRHNLNSLVCVGGDGSMKVAAVLQKKGIPIVGVPKTIDNDVALTEMSIGFDSAVAVATESLDRLRSTAASHHRVMVVEVMGRNAGWVAVHAGTASGADVILIPEIHFSTSNVCRIVQDRVKKGRRYSIVTLAEGAGMGPTLAKEIERKTGLESRAVVLGHLQRGGPPTPFDRLLATRLGTQAGLMANARTSGRGRVLCWRGNQIRTESLEKVAGLRKSVPMNDPLIVAAKRVGTSFGDHS